MKKIEQKGMQSILFNEPPCILSGASVVGKKEGEGPLKDYFDEIIEDAMFGKDNWEEAESEFMKEACNLAITKSKVDLKQIRYLFGGDLLGQLIGTTFGISALKIPFFGLYGACSTIGEALSLGSITISSGAADYVLATTSSHFASAEKQFRYPLEYGNQRPLASTWTVTGSAAFILSKDEGDILIKGITTGKIMDYGIKDSMNMGACMAPAAADLIYQNLKDFQIKPDYYDKIITGDLGKVGQEILFKLLKDNGVNIERNHMDCGIEIFDDTTQDTHAGGSGCGCSATTLAGMIMNRMSSGKWKRVLFIPTGALLSTVSFNEGQTVPGIAHGVILERR